MEDHQNSDETIENIQLSAPPPSEETINQFFNAVRYGMRSDVLKMLQTSKELVHVFDLQGYHSTHWAAKRGDVELLKILFEHGAYLGFPTKYDAHMLPIHWAASDGQVQVLKFLIDHHQDLNVQDTNGCTPLIISSQHDKTSCAIYLIENHADTSLKDSNGDTALHWAAYKGYVSMTALLAHYMPQQLDKEDNFGQTPLHLASLRGHPEVVEYLAKDCHVDYRKKDRNGLTALDLAVKKGQFKVEWALRQIMSQGSVFQFIKILHSSPTAVPTPSNPSSSSSSSSTNLVTSSSLFANKKLFFSLIFGGSEVEISVWAWRVVFLSNLTASLISLFSFSTDSHLLDLSYLHQFSAVLQIAFWVFFALCLFVPPGSVINNHNNTSLKSSSSSFLSSSSSSSSSSHHDDESSVSLLRSSTTSTTEHDVENQHNHNQQCSHNSSSSSSSSSCCSSSSSNLLTYESALKAYGTLDFSSCPGSRPPALCHTCGVVKPLRSKHCKHSRRCVQKFDHFCPFVGNTVGRDNYKYFLGVLISNIFCLFTFQATAILLYWRANISWLLIFFVLYSFIWMLMVAGLLHYHSQLVSKNLTTNEHINVHKYPYMKDEENSIDNPFDRGNFSQNLMDALSPPTTLYYTREQVLREIRFPGSAAAQASFRAQQQRCGGGGGGGGGVGGADPFFAHSHSHEHGHEHSHGHGHNH